MGLKAISRLIKGAPDYESGIWTPTLGVTSGTDGVHTYSQQVGYYERIGNLVWVSATLTVSALDVSISGDIAIKGLPFANGIPDIGVEFVASALSGVTINSGGGYLALTGTLRADAGDVAIRETGNNISRANITNSDLASACGFVITGVYRVA
tara:strand:+ start:342 stop:800 length:459 start_codon:yes stop_codon:yes gene_type:complete